MNYPQNTDELLHWDTFREHDSFGWFTVITGYENTGRCSWCGKEILGRRRYCQRGSGCWSRYQEHFAWTYASHWTSRRANHHCENCGKAEIDIPITGGKYNERSGLEIHHIIPLNGKERTVSVYNIFWNLICLCHDCHMELHSIMRGEKEILAKPDIFELALKRGQGILLGQ